MRLGLLVLGLRQTRDRGVCHSAEVDENVNLGHGQDQGYS